METYLNKEDVDHSFGIMEDYYSDMSKLFDTYKEKFNQGMDARICLSQAIQDFKNEVEDLENEVGESICKIHTNRYIIKAVRALHDADLETIEEALNEACDDVWSHFDRGYW